MTYLAYLGQDLPNGFAAWTCKHFWDTTCDTLLWEDFRIVFISSSMAHKLLRNPSQVMGNCPPFKVAAGIGPRQVKIELDISRKEAVIMGMAMEDVVRRKQVAEFSSPLKTFKPGRVVSHYSGLACSVDIELVDDVGVVCSLMEVKTLVKAMQPANSAVIPTKMKSAVAYVRKILHQNNQFLAKKDVTKKHNIFRQSSRFVDTECLAPYGEQHLIATKKINACRLMTKALLLKSSCHKADVTLYFYKPGMANPDKEFTMDKSELGLILNPLCDWTSQMFHQDCVYRSSCCRTINRQHEKGWMYLILVIPFATKNVENPQPHVIMKMPVHFDEELFKQFDEFYASEVYNYITSSN